MNQGERRDKENMVAIVMNLIETRRRARQSRKSFYYLRKYIPENHPNIERMRRIIAEDRRKYANAWINAYACINEPFGHEDIELMGTDNGHTI